MNNRDHGGGLDAAVSQYGGTRDGWLDLSTGINPAPYPVSEISSDAWAALPDRTALQRLENAARKFWQVPDGAEVVIASGASALIARIPALFEEGTVFINNPTYNEHEAAFRNHAGWSVTEDAQDGNADIFVHPNNPSGRLFEAELMGRKEFCVIDESFCDVTPDASHIDLADNAGVVILKSFGKFWGLAGLRLGFAICAPKSAARLHELLGPWPVSGPALEIGARALEDLTWAQETRARLAADADRLDALMIDAGATVVGGTTLFRLYDVVDAAAWQDKLAQGHVWSRIFPYSTTWLRLGLPAPDRWAQLEAAL
ncbi:threonine-phosphate decarboxylase [Litoreibacter janthinus]|uniref:Aminotransferase n=1 Tax=Litoreibacter janthinus TaxID=670154 RepID=A0A1I6FTT9_9RHOB|nr:threonine-phosphate decarboxylase [Litoreibacter janthinus]SFR33370.1 L-threonine O-3-phosphate decarboxylase [Litoreibacter janthinus]